MVMRNLAISICVLASAYDYPVATDDVAKEIGLEGDWQHPAIRMASHARQYAARGGDYTQESDALAVELLRQGWLPVVERAA